ncbi:MAG: B12-binding domain-containing radical SAM protein [Candidatus Omnitrophica bacterium]|nr:B12-binding domain-containing radical SAM protein [Candidatus Omnitrophota bacterium]MCM8790579.1 B12-binding domain-containing radical SAM protein [Candidatus Omnitrophota bacterium]
MKILLINPSQEKVYGRKMAPAYPPLGVLYIGTVLEKDGHRVRFADIDTEGLDEQKFKTLFTEFDPDTVGISSVTPTFKDALRWAKISKSLKKEVPVILGGIHATIAPQEAICEENIDIVVVGEGEETIRQLCEELSKEKPSLHSVKGIYFKKDGKSVATERRPFIDDLDSIPFPDRSLLKRPDAYMPPDAERLPAMTIITSRGCPGSCTFCCTKHIFSKTFRMRSVANIIAEIEGLVNGHGIREIHIADDIFTLNKKRALEFCDEVKKRDLGVHFQFMNGLRADCVDREILVALKNIGIKTVGYGVESGNDAILKRIKKNIPLDVTRKAFKLSKELGFETWAFLIFGLPGETEETIKDTITFTKELDPDFAKFLILKPYPGSDVYAELLRDNLIFNTDYDNYGVYTEPVHRLPALEPDRMIYWQKRAFREFYLRPSKILTHARRIRSLQQLKLALNGAFFAFYCMFKKDKTKS